MPVDRGAIDAQLRDIGEGDQWWEQREFRDLPYVLQPEERIQGIINGKLLGPRRARLIPGRRVLPARRWLVVATDQRLVCLRQERFVRKQVELRSGEILGMWHTSRIRTCQLTLDTSHGRYRIRIPKLGAFRFVSALAPLMPRPAALPAKPGLPAPTGFPIAHRPGLSGLVDRISLLASPDFATRADLARLAATVERLEAEVERLQQQVDFLEELLEKRAEGALSLPGSSVQT